MRSRTLSKALKQATDDGLIPRNAAGLIKPPRPRSEEIRPLEREQVRALLESVRGDRLEVIYVVLVTAGLRNGKGRNIRLTQRAVTALREHRRRQLEERMEHGALWQDHGLVFASGIGTPLLGGNLNRSFKATLRRAGPPEIRFHDLRHTCATLPLRQGVNPKFVQELLGHADIALTLNVYSHVLPDMGDAASRAMDAALG